jgi:hypothetical protein
MKQNQSEQFQNPIENSYERDCPDGRQVPSTLSQFWDKQLGHV